MNRELRASVDARLEQDAKLSDEMKLLIEAALAGEIEEYLGGQAPSAPAEPPPEAAAPAAAFIDAVEVEGFRGIGPSAKLDLTPGPGLTLVVGRNGSGKSSFAEALEFLLTGDNQRWNADRAKIWKEGWRNLHQTESTRIQASLFLEGQKNAHVASRKWSADAGLDDGEAVNLDALGWEQPLGTYRPFLSYNELGSMLEEGPSKLFDALASILGLEDLIDAADGLKNARSQKNKAHKSVKDEHKALRAALEEHDDERATQGLAALKGTKWKLEAVEGLAASGGAASEGSELETLRTLSNLHGPNIESVASGAAALKEAITAAQRIEGTDAAKARRRAELLDKALVLHRHDGDGDCPICGRESALDASWRKETETEASALRKEAEDAENADKARRDAEQSVRALVTSTPDAVTKAGALGLDADDAERAWTVWSETSELDGLGLAEAAEARAPALGAAVDYLREQAQEKLAQREDAWRPMARRLSDWLPGARAMMEEAPKVKELKAAEDWVRETATALRNERFQPIKEDVKKTWEQLRTQSNVELEDVTFEGKTTSRRMNLEVSVDGTEGVALGVMSQGELHALALSLFIPRATLDESPFRFLVIDDPVQSMDPARVDGLARVLEEQAKDRQVIVFTHDDRLPDAARRLGVSARVIEVQRREGSVVELREVRTPAVQYVRDAGALANTDDLPKIARERVIPGLCRQAVEAACLDVVRKRRLARGETHAAVEDVFERNVKLMPRLALALFDDPDKTGDVYTTLKNKIGPWQVDTVKLCNEGAHKGFPGGDPRGFVENVKQLVAELQKQK